MRYRTSGIVNALVNKKRAVENFNTSLEWVVVGRSHPTCTTPATSAYGHSNARWNPRLHDRGLWPRGNGLCGAPIKSTTTIAPSLHLGGIVLGYQRRVIRLNNIESNRLPLLRNIDASPASNRRMMSTGNSWWLSSCAPTIYVSKAATDRNGNQCQGRLKHCADFTGHPGYGRDDKHKDDMDEWVYHVHVTCKHLLRGRPCTHNSGTCGNDYL